MAGGGGADPITDSRGVPAQADRCSYLPEDLSDPASRFNA